MLAQAEAPVKGYRVGRKKNQTEVADALKISREWYSKKETGEIPFKTTEINDFAKYFGEDVWKVLHLFFPLKSNQNDDGN